MEPVPPAEQEKTDSEKPDSPTPLTTPSEKPTKVTVPLMPRFMGVGGFSIKLMTVQVHMAMRDWAIWAPRLEKERKDKK